MGWDCEGVGLWLFGVVDIGCGMVVYIGGGFDC